MLKICIIFMPLSLWCDDVILCPYFENQTDEKKEKKINEEPKINMKRCKKKVKRQMCAVSREYDVLLCIQTHPNTNAQRNL